MKIRCWMLAGDATRGTGWEGEGVRERKGSGECARLCMLCGVYALIMLCDVCVLLRTLCMLYMCHGVKGCNVCALDVGMGRVPGGTQPRGPLAPGHPALPTPNDPAMLGGGCQVARNPRAPLAPGHPPPSNSRIVLVCVLRWVFGAACCVMCVVV